MGSRPYHASEERQIKTRKQIKKALIYQKNKFRLAPQCVVAGEAHCDDWPSDEPLTRADVLFFHSSKKRYFYAQIVTATRVAFENAHRYVRDQLVEMHPFPELMFAEKTCVVMLGKNNKVVGHRIAFTQEFQDACNAQSAAEPDLLLKRSQEEVSVPLQWIVRDIDPVCAYIDVVIDKEAIGEKEITDFLARFRSFGEPVTAGVIFDNGVVNKRPIEYSKQYLAKREN